MSPEEEWTSTEVPTGTCSTISASHGPKLNAGQLPLIITCVPSLIARTRGACSEPLVWVSTCTSPSWEGRIWISPGPASTVRFFTGPGIVWRLVCSTAPIVQPATCTAEMQREQQAQQAADQQRGAALAPGGHRCSLPCSR